MASTKDSVFRIIRRQRLTEKSALASSVDKGVVFEVHPRANKLEVKAAIEKIFDVKVKSVRIVNCPGKIKRVGLKSGRQRSWKKVYVSLKEGSIDLIEGL